MLAVLQGEGLKMTFHKKAEKSKMSLDPMEAEKGKKLQYLKLI